jgi:hypothetical protein
MTGEREFLCVPCLRRGFGRQVRVLFGLKRVLQWSLLWNPALRDFASLSKWINEITKLLIDQITN